MGLRKIIRNTVKTVVKWAITDDRESNAEYDMRPQLKGSIGNKISHSSHGIDMNGLNFTIHSATGGKVVEVKTYDPRTDRSVNSLYVITDKEDLGEELGQIVTKESLCR